MSKSKMANSMTDDVDEIVSKNLRMRRIFLGLHQQDLAMAANITVQQIQKYELGKNKLSSSKLYILAKFLKVPVNYFFYRTKLYTREFEEYLAEVKGKNTDQVSEEEVIKFIKYYVAISDRGIRKHFLDLIKSIAYDR